MLCFYLETRKISYNFSKPHLAWCLKYRNSLSQTVTVKILVTFCELFSAIIFSVPSLDCLNFTVRSYATKYSLNC